METSRDDFVIAIRSAFLKKGTQQRFSLLGLISFSIIFLILGSLNFKVINYIKIGINEAVYRSSFIVSGPENFIKDNYLVVQKHFQLMQEKPTDIFFWQLLQLVLMPKWFGFSVPNELVISITQHGLHQFYGQLEAITFL